VAAELPPNVSHGLRHVVRRLGLRYASCDLLLDHDDRYHFLEANVSGNWLLTEATGQLPISRAIATALVNAPSTDD
jgi:glutathione synthase/RimK-type ligase-like ATP-grasp enzyme